MPTWSRKMEGLAFLMKSHFLQTNGASLLQMSYSASSDGAYDLHQCWWPLLLPTAKRIPRKVACIHPTQGIFTSLFHFDRVYTVWIPKVSRVHPITLVGWKAELWKLCSLWDKMCMCSVASAPTCAETAWWIPSAVASLLSAHSAWRWNEVHLACDWSKGTKGSSREDHDDF